jgi:hypothetical protein
MNMCAAKSGTPSFGQRRRRDHGADDVAGGHRDREADDPHDQRREQRGQREAAARIGDDDRAELEAEPGLGDYADDDSRRRARRRHVQHLSRAVAERREQFSQAHRGVAAEEGDEPRDQRRIEHREDRRKAPDHEHDDRDQRQEVIPVLARQFAEPEFRLGRDLGHAELARVDLDHEQQRKVVEHRRDRGHQQHVEIADLQEFGDQECRGTKTGGEMIAPNPPAASRPPAASLP